MYSHGSRPIRGRGDQRPCDFCRKRKARCIVYEQTPCERCKKSRRQCTFTQEPRSVVTSTQSSVRQYRSPANDSMSAHSVPAGKPVRNLETDFSVDQALMNESSVRDTLWPWTPGVQSSDPSPQLAQQRFAADGDALLENQEVSLESISGVERPPSPQAWNLDSALLLGRSSQLDPLLRTTYKYDDKGKFQSAFRSFLRVGNAGTTPLIFKVMPPQLGEKVEADRLVPPRKGDLEQDLAPFREKLVSLFERFVQPTWPVLQSSTIESETLFLSVCALALRWRSHDATLPWSQFHEDIISRKAAPSVDAINSIVWHRLLRDTHSPTYATLQAALLLTERVRPHTAVTDSPFDRCLVTTIVSMALELGLHRDPLPWTEISPSERNFRHHLWWLVYAQDLWSASIAGHPPMIRGGDYDVTLNNYHKPASVFMNLFLQLTMILRDIITSLL